MNQLAVSTFRNFTICICIILLGALLLRQGSCQNDPVATEKDASQWEATAHSEDSFHPLEEGTTSNDDEHNALDSDDGEDWVHHVYNPLDPHETLPSISRNGQTHKQQNCPKVDENKLCTEALEQPQNMSKRFLIGMLQRQTANILQALQLLHEDRNDQDSISIKSCISIVVSSEQLKQLKQFAKKGHLPEHGLDFAWDNLLTQCQWEDAGNDAVYSSMWPIYISSMWPAFTVESYIMLVEVTAVALMFTMIFVLQWNVSRIVIVSALLVSVHAVIQMNHKKIQVHRIRSEHLLVDPDMLPPECKTFHLLTAWETFKLYFASPAATEKSCDQYFESFVEPHFRISILDVVFDVFSNLIVMAWGTSGSAMNEMCDAAFASTFLPVRFLTCYFLKLILFMLGLVIIILILVWWIRSPPDMVTPLIQLMQEQQRLQQSGLALPQQQQQPTVHVNNYFLPPGGGVSQQQITDSGRIHVMGGIPSGMAQQQQQTASVTSQTKYAGGITVGLPCAIAHANASNTTNVLRDDDPRRGGKPHKQITVGDRTQSEKLLCSGACTSRGELRRCNTEQEMQRHKKEEEEIYHQASAVNDEPSNYLTVSGEFIPFSRKEANLRRHHRGGERRLHSDDGNLQNTAAVISSPSISSSTTTAAAGDGEVSVGGGIQLKTVHLTEEKNNILSTILNEPSPQHTQTTPGDANSQTTVAVVATATTLSSDVANNSRRQPMEFAGDDDDDAFVEPESMRHHDGVIVKVAPPSVLLGGDSSSSKTTTPNCPPQHPAVDNLAQDLSSVHLQTTSSSSQSSPNTSSELMDTNTSQLSAFLATELGDSFRSNQSSFSSAPASDFISAPHSEPLLDLLQAHYSTRSDVDLT